MSRKLQAYRLSLLQLFETEYLYLEAILVAFLIRRRPATFVMYLPAL